jgi:ribonuclease HI
VEGCENLIFEEEKPDPTGLWTLRFDGACNANGNGAGVLLVSPKGKQSPYRFKLEFSCTNNVAEYEALILGLDTTRKMGMKLIQIFGDSDLIVNQEKGSCQTRHPRLRQYKHEVWDMFDNFLRL